VSDNAAGGQSAEFTGLNSVQADMTGADPLKTSIFSLVFWIKYGSQGSFGMPMSRAGSNNTPWVAQIDSTGLMNWVPRGSGAGVSVPVGTFQTGGADSDPWHQVVISQNYDTASTYLDGVPVSKYVATAILSSTNQTPLRIGRRGDGFLFKGRLDDLQIYTDALQAPEVAYLYAHPGQTVVPVSPLELQVNRVTGETIIRNPSSNTTPVLLIN
jgi:hypothetical protein